MVDAKVVGIVIQQFRERKRMSQELVSGLAGIGRTHLSAIERGERKPTLETFCRIADALQMRPSELLAEIEKSIGETARECENAGKESNYPSSSSVSTRRKKR